LLDGLQIVRVDYTNIVARGGPDYTRTYAVPYTPSPELGSPDNIHAFFSHNCIVGAHFNLISTFLYADLTHVYLEVSTMEDEGDYMQGYVVIFNKNSSKIA